MIIGYQHVYAQTTCDVHFIHKLMLNAKRFRYVEKVTSEYRRFQ